MQTVRILRFLALGLLIPALIVVYGVLFWGMPEVVTPPERCPEPYGGERLERYEDPLTGLGFVRLPAGCFWMGSPEDEEGRSPHEGPRTYQHVKAFYMGETPVTRGAFARFVAETGYVTDAEKEGISWVYTGSRWEALAGYSWKNPGHAQTEEDPVVHVSLQDARAMASWMSRRGRQYRLPSEPEWEYGARGGSSASRFWGDDLIALASYANVADFSARSRFPGWIVAPVDDGFVFTSPVAAFLPNAYGLHDMLGNVWEWCDTRYSASAYQHERFFRPGPKDPVVIRGGSWYTRPEGVRSASREFMGRGRRWGQDVGFRLVLEKRD
ncbi:formylglycine-generating enzyme family protein [Desulfobotulus sp.]|jgi:formylglycine-generating enzyme required for sulfatase activity|uniref:formylglycine-generating enzyme family protein n=1 Tax=Desulfobotulus sp. TaxID=1940337 RepID=UPI002A36C167|nr:formylglycine-generating enzyme family protein [Desulfobotulus sp.]MDY0163682.1 formylglycine-generating enzyme family protein [Desulfobotulus sp.]